MADYDWGKGCCGELIGHKEWCKESLAYPAYLHTEHQKNLAKTLGGFEYQKKSDTFRCLRGCGCVVWDPKAHIKNVCTSLTPEDARAKAEARSRRAELDRVNMKR